MPEPRRRGARYAIIGAAGGALLDALLATTRFDVDAPATYRALREARKPIVHILWHGRLLPLSYLHRGEGIATLISRSADGEYIARVVEHWGYHTTRGSSSRGGSRALRELVAHVRNGRSLAITPDGPRGPKGRLKGGAITAAQLTGAPMVPVAAGASRAWWIEGWDRFMVPKPFARIRVTYGEPIDVPRDADAGRLEAIRRHAESELDRLTREVDRARA